jgi:DnaJ-class molecular chaperone
VLNATSEAELLAAYGWCGRCGGTGSVLADEARPNVKHRRSCPRCGGSGRKGVPVHVEVTARGRRLIEAQRIEELEG